MRATSQSMSTAEVRAIFERAIELQPNADKRASLEICREYFTNPTFRKALEDYTAQINGCRDESLTRGDEIGEQHITKQTIS